MSSVFEAAITAETWSVTQTDRGRVVITLRGDFEAAHAVALETTLRESLAAVPAGAIEVVVSIGDLTRCTVEAREVLLRTQRHLAGVARRTAYVANRPLFRGVGLWICHRAPDAHARTFPNLELAEVWLAETTRRDDDLARTSARWVARMRGEREAST